jgi:dTDP-glucose 4,6-dehydratase
MRGQTVKLGNLHPTRDLNFVGNIVEGYLLAAERPAAIGQTVNLGSGREISIGDLAKLIGKISGKPIQIATESQRVRPENSEVERLLADNARAEKLLGWGPRVSLEDGLKLTVDWIRGNLTHYTPGAYVL